MATFNSRARRPANLKLAVAALFLSTSLLIAAAEDQSKIFAARIAAEFHRAQIQFQSDKNNSTNAWQFACAASDFADGATNDTQRADIASQAIAACRPLIAREPKNAAAHYYLAMNLGQLARTELLGALKLVREMDREFKTAADLDVHFDFAGPERCLGLLYRDAPGWPASVGSKRKAKNYLEQAEKLAPDYPENPLNLAESDLQWRESDAAKLELAALDSLWPKAQTNLNGVQWEQSWADWSARRDAVRKKLGEAPVPAKSPKNRQ